MRIPSVIFAVLMLMASCKSPDASNAQEEASSSYGSPDDIAKAILTSISQNDYESLTNLVVMKEDMTAIINASSFPEDRKKEVLGKADEEMRKTLSGAKRCFDETRSNGETAGIIWKDVAFKKSEYEMKKEHDIETMDLKIIFDFKGVEYPIQCRDLVKSPRGWRIAGPFSYAYVSEEAKKDMEEEARRIADSLADAINAEAEKR